jgi:hypothetical protein
LGFWFVPKTEHKNKTKTQAHENIDKKKKKKINHDTETGGGIEEEQNKGSANKPRNLLEPAGRVRIGTCKLLC